MSIIKIPLWLPGSTGKTPAIFKTGRLPEGHFNVAFKPDVFINPSKAAKAMLKLI